MKTDILFFTKNRLAKAKNIYNRYKTIYKYLVTSLKLNESESAINACKLEHVLTDNCYSKIKKLNKEELC